MPTPLFAPARSSFETLFPFHFAVNRGLVIVQAGPALRQMARTAILGQTLAEAFEILRPDSPRLTASALAAAEGTAFELRARSSGLRLTGQWVPDERDDAGA